MAEILVCGAGPIGLAEAVMLRRDGHDVTVLERDAEPLPDTPQAAWDGWRRGSVPHFGQAHFVHARFRHELEATLPDVARRLDATGALRHDQLGELPQSISDRERRDDDDKFVTLTARRAWLEHAIASVAEDEVDVRRGVRIEGPVLGEAVVAGVPHIAGVRASDGQEIRADIVIDAMGRRSPLSEWMESAGGRPPTVEGGDIGFTYYTRFFQGDGIPEGATANLAEYHTFTVLTLPADNNAWSVTLYASSGDQPLKRLRLPDVFERVVRACPLQAHWLDADPITDVHPMSGVMDKLRTFVVDGAPLVTGAIPLGDAWSCTNPSLGRGLSIGMVHARLVRRAIAESGDDYPALAKRVHEDTEAECTPWVRMQMDMDAARVAAVEAARDGRELPAPDPMAASLTTAMQYDADLFRAFAEIVTCQATPQELMARPGLIDKVMEHAGKPARGPLPGPTRAELLELVA